MTNSPAPDRRASPQAGHLYLVEPVDLVEQLSQQWRKPTFRDWLDRKLITYGWGFLSGCLFTTGAAYVIGLFL